MYRKIRCDVRQWNILETFRETKHSLRGFLMDGDTRLSHRWRHANQSIQTDNSRMDSTWNRGYILP